MSRAGLEIKEYFVRTAQNWGIFLNKVVISVCLFVCPILTHEPLDWFDSEFDCGTRENYGNEWFESRKIAKIVTLDQARVNCGSNYEYLDNDGFPR